MLERANLLELRWKAVGVMKVKNGGGLAWDDHIGNIWKWTHSECFRGDNDSTCLLIGLGKVIPRFLA